MIHVNLNSITAAKFGLFSEVWKLHGHCCAQKTIVLFRHVIPFSVKRYSFVWCDLRNKNWRFDPNIFWHMGIIKAEFSRVQEWAISDGNIF